MPLPANYGGVIDVFYKIKILSELGVGITLHCFQNGRSKAEELEGLCDKVYYYKRDTNFLKQLSGLPYIVNSRSEERLLDNLLVDDAPILMEGLHATFLLPHYKLTDRVKLVRMHNIEWKYYKNLANISVNPFKKIYFYLESYKLKRYEHILKYVSGVLAISPADYEYLEKILIKQFIYRLFMKVIKLYLL